MRSYIIIQAWMPFLNLTDIVMIVKLHATFASSHIENTREHPLFSHQDLACQFDNHCDQHNKVTVSCLSCSNC